MVVAGRVMPEVGKGMTLLPQVPTHQHPAAHGAVSQLMHNSAASLGQWKSS